jgi:hypothetical protein
VPYARGLRFEERASIVSETAKKLAFVAFYLECYKRRHQLSGEKSAELFCHYGLDRYLYEEYDILHSMGESTILDYVERYIDVRKDKG